MYWRNPQRALDLVSHTRPPPRASVPKPELSNFGSVHEASFLEQELRKRSASVTATSIRRAPQQVAVLLYLISISWRRARAATRCEGDAFAFERMFPQRRYSIVLYR